MKEFVLKFVLPFLIGIFILTDLMKRDDSILFNFFNSYYGELEITSQVDGLNITINEKNMGIIKKGEVFKYEFNSAEGSGDMGRHEIIFQKDIDANKEYYLETSCYLLDEELKNKEIEKIDITSPYYDYYENKDYKTTYERVNIRLKRAVLLKQSGLIKEVKLKHNGSYHMSYDDENLYILSRASTSMYKKAKQEKIDGDFLEIYNLKNLNLVSETKLGESDDMFGDYTSVVVNENYIYAGTYKQYVEYIKKEDLSLNKPKKVLNRQGYRGQINSIKTYKDYVFTLDEGGAVCVYKNNKYLYTIHTHSMVSKLYYKLEDKKFGSVFDLLVHKNIIYISNDLGMIYKFKLNDKMSDFLGAMNTIEYEKEYEKYVADDIPSMLIYKDRYLLFSREYGGLNMYDTKLKRMVYKKKTLYSKDIQYSKMFKEDVDMTKSTNIYRMLIYKDNLIFSEVNDEIIVYNFTKNKIIHRYSGVSGSMFEMMVYNDTLISLSSDGKLYVWDLHLLKQYDANESDLKKIEKQNIKRVDALYKKFNI